MKKIRKINLPHLPIYITGKLRKDGKPDKRYTNGMYILEENMNKIG